MNKINKKYVCWSCLFLILIIIISIFHASNNIEGFEDKSLDTRVKTLEEKINGIDNNLQKTSEKINNIGSNLEKINTKIEKKDEKMTFTGRVELLENNANLFNNMVDKFKQNNEERYKKMYLWYAKLTGADPEEVKKDQENTVKNNEDKIKNLEAEMEQKYNKK